MAIKVLNASDIGVPSRQVRSGEFISALAEMKAGQAIQSPGYPISSLTLANLVCPDRQWRQRKGDDGKKYIVCVAKDAK